MTPSEKLVSEVSAAMTGSGLFEHISGKWGVIWKAEQLPDEYQFRSDAIAHIDRLRAQAAIAIVVERAAEVARAEKDNNPADWYDFGAGCDASADAILTLSDRSREGK